MPLLMPSVAVALTVATASGAAADQPQPGSEALPDSFVLSQFELLLRGQFYRRPERFAFFGEVGPLNGCDAVEALIAHIAQRDLRAFRSEYAAAARAALQTAKRTPESRAQLSIDLSLHPQLRSIVLKRLSPAGSPLDGRAGEVVARLGSWAQANGYAGRRLGYNRNGIAYWASNLALPELVCATPPSARAALLKDWR
jgi:hypothetical protein